MKKEKFLQDLERLHQSISAMIEDARLEDDETTTSDPRFKEIVSKAKLEQQPPITTSFSLPKSTLMFLQDKAMENKRSHQSDKNVSIIINNALLKYFE